MRVVERAEDFVAQFEQASAEALAAFGNAEVYLESFLPAGSPHRDPGIRRQTRQLRSPRRTRLQRAAPAPEAGRGSALTRARPRHPPPNGRRGDGADQNAQICQCRHGRIHLRSRTSGKFFFIEMNTRIQVEHPVTEMVTGTDLVAEQFRVAAGERLSFGRALPDGAPAIEFRINAEDATRDFQPSPGTLKRWRPPTGREIRVDSHAYENYAVPPYYDSMLAKLIVSGPDRASCDRNRQIRTRALSGFRRCHHRPVPRASAAATGIRAGGRSIPAGSREDFQMAAH